LKFGIIGILFLDFMIIVFAKYFLPKDQLYHTMGYDDGRKKVMMTFLICFGLCFVIFPFIAFSSLPTMLKAAIIFTPMIAVGYYANYHEKLVEKRDALFPAFIRSLGDVHHSKGGTLTSTIETLLPHNFGILNDMLERLYKRLRITANKFSSWYYFSKESGSALIAEFMDIFISVVYRGGSADIAGKIVSENMSRINGLRYRKKEFGSTLKGNIYGTFFGLAVTLYIAFLISIILAQIFSSMTEGVDGLTKELVDSIIPVNTEVSLDKATFFVALILTSHALISSYMVKEVDGGNKFSMFTDTVILLWLGAGIEIGLTLIFKGLFSQYFG
jgi:archaellum biogenesis protein FlaJ (TadC family)